MCDQGHCKVFTGAEWDGLADCAEGLPIQWGMLRCSAGVGSPAWFAGLCFVCNAGVDVVMGCRYAAWRGCRLCSEVLVG